MIEGGNVVKILKWIANSVEDFDISSDDIEEMEIDTQCGCKSPYAVIRETLVCLAGDIAADNLQNDEDE